MNGDMASNLPSEGAQIEPLVYHMGFSFHPSIKLDQKSALQFTSTLSEYISPRNISLESDHWTVSGTDDGVELTIGQSILEFAVSKPTHRQEWYEERYHTILSRFGESFEPQVILRSTAMIRGLLQIDGDARDFLASQMLHVDQSDFTSLRRPIHIIGLRLFLPPYRVQQDGPEGKTVSAEDWAVNLKIESWAADPSKIFVESSGTWEKPVKWDEQCVGEVVGRLEVLHEYLNTVLENFVKRSPNTGEE